MKGLGVKCVQNFYRYSLNITINRKTYRCWKDNIKSDHMEILCEGVDCIQLDQD
jgi:hypothetical protein